MTVSGAPAAKAARLVAPAEPIVVHGPPPRFVGRGAGKLEGALARFEVPVEGRRCLDVGASTGGFTDCLLQHGAAVVVALDVGYGQLHERLRADPRVEVHERTNIRHVRPGDLGDPFEVVVADLSFISLRTVLPAVVALARPGADAVLLVKPQFEAGREEVAKGRGVVTDPAIWGRVLREVLGALRDAGAAIMGAMVSPLTGADGNVEFLVHAVTGRSGADPEGSQDLAGLVAAVVRDAQGRFR